MKTSIRLLLALLFVCTIGTTASYGKGYNLPVHSVTLTKVDSDTAIVNIILLNYDTLPGNRVDTIKWSFYNDGFKFSGWTYNFCDFSTCYYSPNLPSGATDYLTPKTNGSFKLTVTGFNKQAYNGTMKILVWDNKDVNNPDTVTININATRLGIENNLLPTSSVSVFPNPATSHINLETNQAGFVPVNAVVFNSLGKAVYEQTVSGGMTSLLINDLPKGVYILNLRDHSGHLAIKQFVKE